MRHHRVVPALLACITLATCLVPGASSGAVVPGPPKPIELAPKIEWVGCGSEVKLSWTTKNSDGNAYFADDGLKITVKRGTSKGDLVEIKREPPVAASAGTLVDTLKEPTKGAFYSLSVKDAENKEIAKGEVVLPAPSPLPMPTEVKATPGDRQVRLTWKYAGPPAKFAVRRSGADSSTTVAAGRSPTAECSNEFIDVKLEPGATLLYSMRAIPSDSTADLTPSSWTNETVATVDPDLSMFDPRILTDNRYDPDTAPRRITCTWGRDPQEASSPARWRCDLPAVYVAASEVSTIVVANPPGRVVRITASLPSSVARAHGRQPDPKKDCCATCCGNPQVDAQQPTAAASSPSSATRASSLESYDELFFAPPSAAQSYAIDLYRIRKLNPIYSDKGFVLFDKTMQEEFQQVRSQAIQAAEPTSGDSTPGGARSSAPAGTERMPPDGTGGSGPAGTGGSTPAGTRRDRASLFVRSADSVVLISVELADGTVLSLPPIDLVLQRWWIDVGGFYAFRRLSDQELVTAPLESAADQPARVQVLRLSSHHENEAETGVMSTFFPANYPALGVSFGLAENSGRSLSYYLGAGVRLLGKRSTAVASFTAGITMAPIRRYPGINVEPGDSDTPANVYDATSPLLLGEVKNEVDWFVAVTLGFALDKRSAKNSPGD